MGNATMTIKLNLANLTRDVPEEVVLRTVKKTEEFAKQYVRVDTGQLRGSIVGLASGLTGEISSDSDHALVQEYGSPFGKSSIKPTDAPAGGGDGYTYTPYMRPAAAKASSDEEIQKSVDAAMRRYK